ncbi:MAG: NADH-quinone oxidoreductase subunit D [Thermodesulfovibrionales bacterium]|nr:NADH-quinone oxidoreductase subunit D [Thermodesulfovibrionales bacterium]
MEQVEITKGSDIGLHTQELTLNMGPQHPATHGVLRLFLELDGEVVKRCTPHVGYLHRGIEKLSESRAYPSVMPLTDRLDYISSMINNIGYCIAVERLMGIEPPPRAKYIRTLLAELTRISSHLLWLATHALDIGAMTVFLYCFREREQILGMFEDVIGARLTVSYPRIGGVRCDITDGFLEGVGRFIDEFPSRIVEYETLIDKNRIWLQRTKGIGVISGEEAVRWGLTGATLRGSGINYDVRKKMPYDAYDEIEFDVPLGQNGDVYDRYRCRMEEMRQSVRIIQQCIEKMPKGEVLSKDAPDLDMNPKGHKRLEPEMSLWSANVSFSNEYTTTPKGELYSAVEAPKGELGFYIVSDGTGRPYRMRVRSPSFVHAAAIPRLCQGHMIADVIAVIGTIDIVMGECDR